MHLGIMVHHGTAVGDDATAQSLALNGKPDEAIRQLLVMRALHGEAAYAQVKAGWTVLAHEKYPQLQTLKLP
jgi:hypothetical protein